jgi:hypothetical protein
VLVRHLAPVPDQPPAIRFAEVVRSVTAVARQRGLQVPVFRSPPRLAEVDRTIRRRADGQAVVAIRLTDRPFAAVQADVIAGVVAVNGLEGTEAGRFRRAAWMALDDRPIDLRDRGGDRHPAATAEPPAASIPA